MKKVRCPICDQAMPGPGPLEWPHWPFCSRRCQVIDLGRWLGGAYGIPTPGTEDDEDDIPKPAVPSADPHSEAP